MDPLPFCSNYARKNCRIRVTLAEFLSKRVASLEIICSPDSPSKVFAGMEVIDGPALLFKPLASLVVGFVNFFFFFA